MTRSLASGRARRSAGRAAAIALLTLASGLFLAPLRADEPPAATRPPAIEKEPHLFSYADAKAKAVSVVGDFNAWNEKLHVMKRDSDGTWRLEIRLPKGRIYEYAFMVDGNLVPDPRNPIATDDKRGSILDLASDTPPPPAAGKTGPGSDLGAIAVAFERLQEKLGVLTKQLQELSTQLSKQNDLLVKKDVQIEMVRAENDSLKTERAGLMRDLTEARIRLGELTEKQNELKGEHTAKMALLDQREREAQTLRKQITDLQTKVNTILQEKREASDKGSTDRERAEAAEKALEGMNARYQELARELEEKKSSLKVLLGEDRVRRPAGPGGAPPAAGAGAGPGGAGPGEGPGAGTPAGPGGPGGAGPGGPAAGPGAGGSGPGGPEPGGGAPRLDGKVLNIGEQQNYLFVNLGTKHGIKEGDVFSLYRDGSPVGKVRVFKVWDTYCAANGIDGFDARSAKQGDLVREEQ
ncbi:MAG: hypothetical protein HYZ53_07710 [Planctomycetes bacterium]|nr:hypothetical protein [Planctomycetota bacterium]